LRELGPLRDRLLREAQADSEAAAQTLTAVEAGLAAARRAYLEQRYDDMISGLGRLESDAARALDGHALCSATLWDIEFQLGLAHGARARPGDELRARDRYHLALALDPQRRPDSALYGPDVGFAFLQALAEQRPLRPVARAVVPADASVRVDCQPLADLAGVRPGLHLIQLDAPGFAREARVIDLGPDDRITAELRPDPDDPLGPAWLAGRLDPADPSARAAMLRFTAPLAFVWLAADGDGPRHLARLVDRDRLLDPARGDSPGQAVTAALASLRPATMPKPGRDDKPRTNRRTRLWAGLTSAAVASLALGLGLGLGLRDPPGARLQLVAP
ncbi:MAG: hypothetical protein JNK56_19765, partial [Myxococcales bacterium]|nr:hypothetical protein [Myxococcales bacterium]